VRYAMCMLHRRALACCIGARCIGAIHRLVCCINMTHRCVLHRCIGARCVLHRCALYVASARVGVLHRCALHVASARVASCIGARCIGSRCIGARCIGAVHRLGLPRPLLHRLVLHPIGWPRRSLHRRRAAVPQRRCRVMRCSVRCACAARLGEGRAVFWLPSGGAMRSCAVLWRRCALHDHGHRAVRHRGDIRHRSKGACGASAAMRSLGGCRRTGCVGRLQWAWLRRLVRRMAAAAWCAWSMALSRSRAARSRTARRCVRPARVARPRAMAWYVARCGTADGWQARCMLRRVVYGVRRVEPEWSV
jgi:hypothetical protein